VILKLDVPNILGTQSPTLSYKPEKISIRKVKSFSQRHGETSRERARWEEFLTESTWS